MFRYPVIMMDCMAKALGPDSDDILGIGQGELLLTRFRWPLLIQL